MRYYRSGLTILILMGLVVIGVTVGTSLAQQPQGPWLSLEVSFSPEEVPVGEGFLATVTLRNEGTEPATVDEVTIEFPAGVDYVGQAFGSDLADASEARPSHLRWTGPFELAAAAELELRFWATVTGQASLGPYPVLVSALSGDGPAPGGEWFLTVIPGAVAEAPPAQPPVVERVAAQPSAVQVTKIAEPEVVDPAEDDVVYTVTFSNSGASLVTVDIITDVLPAGFQYVGLAPGSEIGDEPTDDEEPEIVWEGSWEVAAGGTKTLKYWVRVPVGTPVSPDPYTNQVMARYDTTPVGPAYAEVWVGEMPPPPPINVAASDGTYTDKVRVTWNAVTGASSYEVYRATSSGGSKTKLGSPTTNSYDDTAASLGIPYYYWVKACGDSICSDYSEYDTGYREGEGYWVYLPFVIRSEEPATTLPFVDTFAQLSSDWVVFTTPAGPYADQWIWGPAGYYWYDPSAGGHSWDDFALSMLQAPGAQDWTDVQVVTRLRLREDRLGGVWIRGTYQGGNLGGYYVHIQPRNDTVYLWRFPLGSTSVDDATIVSSNDYGPKIDQQHWYHLKVVAQGNNIKAWLKSADEPESAYRPVIDWTDSNSTWMQGTVGLSAYKTFTVYDEIAVTAYP